MKTRYRWHSFHEMIDFPIGKRDFQVRAWSGAFWEPWREKKDKTKCIYKIIQMIFYALQIFTLFFKFQ